MSKASQIYMISHSLMLGTFALIFAQVVL